MSLKAKLEAVIYAAEEPVTLTQLAALFAADALEWKAAQDAADAERAAELAGVSSDAAQPLPLIVQEQESPASGETRTNGESLSVPATGELQPPAPQANETGATADAPQANQVVSIEEGEAYPSIAVEGEPGVPPSEPAPADPESEAKRLARQKDRDVKAVLKQLLDELIAGCQADGRGVEIREIAGGYRMATKPECHDAVRLFVKTLKPPLRLSLPALETLAVIAYKQPVTAPEVSEIRGVESSGVLGSLLARKLIATAGRKPVIGRPILYKTTREFLLRFGLKDVSELPSMEEFEKMAATELEMEPEVAEADKAADSAEAAAWAEETVEQNAEAEFESNSPGEEELADATETADEVETPVEAQSGQASPGSESATVDADAPGPLLIASTHLNAGLEESRAEQEIEATPHAQKSHQESEKDG